ncbi:MAG: serine hydrolase domain-containing protein, partial [Microthrixaceae bacterium]
LAAGRRRPVSLTLPRPSRSDARRTATIAPGVVVMVVALVLPLPMDTRAEAPLSGAAVVARAGRVHESLEEDDGEAETVTIGHLTPTEVLVAWLDANTDAIDRVGLTSLDLAMSWPDGHRELLSWTLDGGVAEGDEIATGEGPMAWWSMTKTITAAWMMELVEQGVVQPDDPVAAYVPEVPRSRSMTLEQLARHTSGIPSDLDTLFFEADPAADLRRLVRGGRLAYEPGEGFEYSRIGYFVLALALERASGTTWREAVESMARRADVEVAFDEDVEPVDGVSDPDGHGYHGALWASGGLFSRPFEAAQLLHWIFTDGLSQESMNAMSAFSSDPERWYYGLGLTPLCPCQTDGDRLVAERFGIDAATGSFAVDRPSGAVVVLRPDQWWEEFSPAPEFFDLQSALLDSLSAG